MHATQAGNAATQACNPAVQATQAGNTATQAGDAAWQAGNPAPPETQEAAPGQAPTPGTTTRLRVVDTAIDLVRDIDRAVRMVRGRHADLVDQLQRAAESVVLNLAEGAGRAGRDKSYHYRVAYASAGEAHTALQLLAAYGLLDAGRVSSLQGRLDQVRAITWRLARSG